MTNSPDSPVPVTLSFDTEGGRPLSPPKQLSMQVSPDLARTFARAHAFNRSDATPLSFTSLLLGMLTGSDADSEWLNKQFPTDLRSRVAARKPDATFDLANLRIEESQLTSLPIPTSISARRAIEEGLSIAASIDAASVFALRHLIAAYPILRDWPHDGDFRDLKIDRLAWCRDFGAYMAGQHPEERGYWRVYADRASPVPLTSFSADVYTERDLLGIDRSVDALALLMASTRTDTPVSIGVFGPWGSGKSFFMRHLRRRIWSLAEREQERVAAWRAKRKDKTATPDDAPLYYANVAQVDFNAWHYNEGNLVASLVDHIFRNLRVLPASKEGDEELVKRQQDVLVKITSTQTDLQTAVTSIDQARKDVDEAKGTVERTKSEVVSIRQVIDDKTDELTKWTDDATRARDQLDVAIRDLTAQSNAVDPIAVVSVALDPLVEAPVVAEMQQAGKALIGALTDWKQFSARLLSPLGLTAVALIVAVPVVAAMTHLLTDVWAAVTAAVATATATLGPVLKGIRERRAAFEKKMAEIEKAAGERREKQQKELETQRAAKQLEWDRKLGGLRQALENQRSVLAERETGAATAVRTLAEKAKDLDEKVQQRATAELRLQQLEADLQRLSSALLLDEFIKDRARTDEYRKQLSFLALVRRDFERLSDLIGSANADWCAPDKDTEPPLLNRIVLYIDDLDRCKMDTVIKVLEVVHLLLAFPLFVCVVAVDPRWIEKCLQKQNTGVFDEEVTDAHVTVADYLEKIFQIPIWMTPIEGPQRATVVKALLGATAAPESRVTAAANTAQESQRLLEADPRPQSTDVVDGFQKTLDEALKRPDPLRITPDEAKFVDSVGELLSDKPRALKRFVNTYRLLKASLSEIDQKTFVTAAPSSPHKVCITQLALFTGQPRQAPTFVSTLQRPDKGNDSRSIAQWFASAHATPEPSFKSTFDLIPDRDLVTIGSFREWLPETSKYLFHRND